MTVNTPVAKVRARRTLADTPRPINLELGGLTPRDGWVVTNVNALARNYLDCTKPWPIEDGSCAFIYHDNVIEHITLEGARVMLREAQRCLAPGGVIRIVTPDLRAHIDLYLAGVRPTDTPAGRQYADMGLTVDHPIDMVRIPIASFGHHLGYLYDFETLASELTAAGFADVRRTELGESGHATLAGIDVRTDEGGAQMAVEATRP